MGHGTAGVGSITLSKASRPDDIYVGVEGDLWVSSFWDHGDGGIELSWPGNGRGIRMTSEQARQLAVLLIKATEPGTEPPADLTNRAYAMWMVDLRSTFAEEVLAIEPAYGSLSTARVLGERAEARRAAAGLAPWE